MGTDVATGVGSSHCTPASVAQRVPAGHPTVEASGRAHTASQASGGSAFARLLRGMGAEIDQGESLVRDAVGAARATTGAGAMGAELIALQVGVYRYGEALDLAARVIDRAVGSVKSVLQGQ